MSLHRSVQRESNKRIKISELCSLQQAPRHLLNLNPFVRSSPRSKEYLHLGLKDHEVGFAPNDEQKKLTYFKSSISYVNKSNKRS